MKCASTVAARPAEQLDPVATEAAPGPESNEVGRVVTGTVERREAHGP